MKRFTKSAWLLIAIVACWPLLSPAQATANLKAGTAGGQIATAAAARDVVLSDVRELTAAELANHPKLHRPLDGLTDAQHQALKDEIRARGLAIPATGHATPAAETEARTYTAGAIKNFDGTNQAGNLCGGCTPSDMALAVGPTWVVQFVNTAISVMDKNGVVQAGYPKSSNAFFGLASGIYTTDPRGFYDWVNNRYVFIMLEETNRFSSSNQGSLLVAASATNDPRGAWHLYNLNIGNVGECPDYPTLGQDSNSWTGSSNGGIYVGINQFGPSPSACAGGYIQNYLLLLPKQQIYAGLGFSYWQALGFNVGGTLVDTLQPVNTMNKSDFPRAEFMVNSYNILFGGGQCRNGCNGLVVWAISNPFGFTVRGGPSPEITGVTMSTVHSYTLPSQADEPGANNAIETIDTRITAVPTYVNGSIFGSMETSAGTENSPIWFEIHPILNDNDARCTGAFLNRCPQITGVDERQEDCFVCNGWANNGSAFFGALQPDTAGNVTMVFSYSDRANYPGLAYTSRRVTYGDSLMHDPGIYLIDGQGFYGQGRWGDYNGVAVDLTGKNSSMWFSGMYAKSDGTWGTRIGNNSFSAVNIP